MFENLSETLQTRYATRNTVQRIYYRGKTENVSFLDFLQCRFAVTTCNEV